MFSTLPGKLFQIAYIVDDIDEAVTQWSALLQVGPFAVSRRHRFVTQIFRGNETDIELSLAFAFSGDVNIELIQVHGQGASVYSEFRASKGRGLQHVAILSENIEADAHDLEARGFAELQRTVDLAGTETRFFDTDRAIGTTLELIQSTHQLRENFSRLREMNESWDGKTALLDIP